MTIRMIALASAAIVSMWLMAPPEAVLAQGVQNSCSKVCDCKFECLDFCGSEQCLRPGTCARLRLMTVQCQRLCNTCQRLSRKK